MSARFDGFDLTFYVATQLGARQTMVFHGDKGFIEVHAPFNTGKYGHGRITLYNGGHTEATEWSFSDTNHYQLQAENFVRATKGEGVMLFSLENSKANQKFIDAIYRAGKSDGFVNV